MNLRNSLCVLFLALIVAVSATAAPIPIEEVARRIRGTEGMPHIYSKNPATEVLVEFGIASWYDCPLKPEKIDDRPMKVKDRIFPVAHKTLPFGTLIKVINPQNGKKILARVIDRGPFITGRIIDLDAEASKALNISGVGKIILKIYKVNPNQVASAR